MPEAIEVDLGEAGRDGGRPDARRLLGDGGLDALAESREDGLRLGDHGQLDRPAGAQRLVVAGRDEQSELELAILHALLQLLECVAIANLHLDLAGLEDGHQLVAELTRAGADDPQPADTAPAEHGTEGDDEAASVGGSGATSTSQATIGDRGADGGVAANAAAIIPQVPIPESEQRESPGSPWLPILPVLAVVSWVAFDAVRSGQLEVPSFLRRGSARPS